MSGLILYSDRPKLFEADIKVNGAKLSETSARLILNFNDNTHIFYEGEISKLGECKIKIPPVKQFEDGGEVVLEVIAESTVFTPWKSTFQIQKSKTVTAEVKELDNDSDLLQENTIDVKVKEDNTEDIKIKENIEQYLQKIPKKQLKKLHLELKNVRLTENVNKWKVKVFENPNTRSANLISKLYLKLHDRKGGY